MVRGDWRGAIQELLTIARFGLGAEWDEWEPRFVVRHEDREVVHDSRHPASPRRRLSPDLTIHLDDTLVDKLLARRFLDVLFQASVRGRPGYLELLKRGLSIHAKEKPIVRNMTHSPSARRHIAKELCQRIRARHAAADVVRIEETIRMWSGEVDFQPTTNQLADCIIPDTVPLAWHDPSRFGFSERARSMCEALAEESAPIAAGTVTLPRYGSEGEQWRTGEPPPWGRGTFYRQDVGFVATAPRFPTIFALVREAADAGRLRHAAFLTMEPGVALQRHADATMFVVSWHLGLHVPQHCALQVAGETRPHAPGHILVFDDSFLHCAWNHSAQRRVLLSTFLLHPDLEDREIGPVATVLEFRSLWDT